MSDWMTIRVELIGRPGEPLSPAPGRLMLAHSDHAFAELADGIDAAFGRWDLTPSHEFEFDGRRYVAGGDPEDPDAEDSEELTLGEVGVRVGTRFRYTFDLGERWLHECLVDEAAVDARAEYGEEPEMVVPVYGWGTIPDQYGREVEGGDDDDVSDVMSEAGDDAWAVVAQAVAGLAPAQPPPTELSAAAARLRAHAGLSVPPYGLLFAAAGTAPDGFPPDEEGLWTTLAAGVVQPRPAEPLDPQAESAWAALEPADWAAAVIGLVRSDVGQSAEPEVLLHLIAACPEVQQPPLEPSDRAELIAALRVVVELWGALGAVDADRRLTALGRWGLPRALERAWVGAADRT